MSHLEMFLYMWACPQGRGGTKNWPFYKIRACLRCVVQHCSRFIFITSSRFTQWYNVKLKIILFVELLPDYLTYKCTYHITHALILGYQHVPLYPKQNAKNLVLFYFDIKRFVGKSYLNTSLGKRVQTILCEIWL